MRKEIMESKMLMSVSGLNVETAFLVVKRTYSNDKKRLKSVLIYSIYSYVVEIRK